MRGGSAAREPDARRPVRRGHSGPARPGGQGPGVPLRRAPLTGRGMESPSRSSERPREVTRLLGAWRAGERGAEERLLPLVYDDLRRLAARLMGRERADHTLQPTALVHEAYLRLAEGRQPRWRDRLHFFSVAARTMRRTLVDHARARCAAKRGAGAVRVRLDALRRGHGPVEGPAPAPAAVEDLLALDQALERLAAADPRKARITELRYFAGLTVDETAELLEVSPSTVAVESRLARAWLVAAVERESPDGRGGSP